MPSMREPRAMMCGRCGAYLTAPPGARSVCCALCDAVTRVQRRTSGLEEFLKGLIYSLMFPPQAPPSSSGDWLPASYPREPPGRKRALLVGISYSNTKYELKGSVNDVNTMSYLLRKRFGFLSDSILRLTAEEGDPNCMPTMKNIRLGMRWLVQGCNTGDAMSLVVHFSARSFDKALCPLDFEDSGVIPDDEINETIVRPLGPGVKLHALVDTDNVNSDNDNVNSDTVVLDLPYRCRILSRTGQWQWENHRPETSKGTNGGLAISISGCRDSQNTRTTSASPVVGGAMTYNFIRALESEPNTTYGRLINAIRAEMSPEPQLRASEEFDIYRKPFLL